MEANAALVRPQFAVMLHAVGRILFAGGGHGHRVFVLRLQELLNCGFIVPQP
jgi:cystathionine beta-lyase family protein involved in aluminum resistance